MAQSQRQKSSSAEDVAIAFYKMAGARPDFRKWVEQSEAYKTTPLREQHGVLRQRVEALENEYNAFRPDTSRIRILVRLQITMTESVSDEKTGKAVIFHFADHGYDSFTYGILDQWITLIVPPLIENWQIALDPLEYKAFYDGLDIQSGRPVYQTDALLVLQPLAVDASRPFVMDGIEQWLMHTDLASFSLWSPSGEFVWRWNPPGHHSSTQSQLNRLRALQ